MSSTPTSLTARFLLWLSDAIYFHRRWFLWPQLALVAASIVFTVLKLEFHTSRNDLVGGDKQYHRNFLDFKSVSGRKSRALRPINFKSPL